MAYAVGSLVKARGREWVVLPDSSDDLLVLRPLGGTDREVAGVYLPLEGDDVRPATFDLPDVSRPGDYSSCRLLRDAVRLGFRSSAGPFRSFARLNVEPRPYQLVPLLMALKLDPIRLLIADDVGIGKTIEAGLIARELLDRGEVQRLAVLCPPHLAEQWQAELREKFHIDPVLVLPSTAKALEGGMAVGQSLFDLYPHVIVSMDYVKSTRRRDEFVRTCPEMIIVDEAHTCAFSARNRGGRHLRHQLLERLSEDPRRHMLLVTATPHSGDEGAFRSLLALLRRDFADLPDDLSGPSNAAIRRAVAAHLVQRRRADVRAYMHEDTTFPTRESVETSYNLTNEYKKLLNTVLDYASEKIQDQSGGQNRQRVRWWSALALLRSLASSPAAAASTLRTRSITADAESAAEADDLGERAVLDMEDVDTGDALDVVPGSVEDEADGGGSTQRERLLRMARRAEALQGVKEDAKLRGAIELVNGLLKDGYDPIVFCRFIPTAAYVADELRKAVPKGVDVAAVTGTLPPAERETRVAQLAEKERRVLVATDCLSEGINLQAHFNAVIHYDLSWNPTRHEQREGRVDRYGQPRATVRTVTYYGVDNQIDGLVLDVLLRKHDTIRSSLGISVPVPGNTSEVIQALMQGLLLRRTPADARQLTLFDVSEDAYAGLHERWEDVAAREARSRTLFAQQTIKVDDVAAEWRAVRQAIGSGIDVRRFMGEVVTAHGGTVSEDHGCLDLRIPRDVALQEASDGQERLRACFELPAPDGAVYLNRTHPIVEGLATYVMDAALDPLTDGAARRCGAIFTTSVDVRTTLLLARFRYHIVTRRGDAEVPLLAEDCDTLGFRDSPSKPEWLPPGEVEPLLAAAPGRNIAPQQATAFLRPVVEAYDTLRAHLDEVARARGEELAQAHARVRDSARLKGVRHEVRPQLPPDILGIYVLLPL